MMDIYNNKHRPVHGGFPGKQEETRCDDHISNQLDQQESYIRKLQWRINFLESAREKLEFRISELENTKGK